MDYDYYTKQIKSFYILSYLTPHSSFVIIHRFICCETKNCMVSCCFRNNSIISAFWRNNSTTTVGSRTGIADVATSATVSFSTHRIECAVFLCVIYRDSCLYTLSQYSHLYSGSFDNSTQIKNAITNATDRASSSSSIPPTAPFVYISITSGYSYILCAKTATSHQDIKIYNS